MVTCSREKAGSKEEQLKVVHGVTTIGGTGASDGQGGSCQAPNPLAEDTDLEEGLATRENESGKTYLKSTEVVGETNQGKDVKGIGICQKPATPTG